MQVQPYLFFNGRCEEAIHFYCAALGATQVMLMRFAESPDGGRCPDGSQPPANNVMHACLQIGATQLLLSDGLSHGKPEFHQGMSLSLSADDDAHAQRLFDALAEGGQVQQPMIETFFATRFGVVADRFGLSWLVLCPRPMPA